MHTSCAPPCLLKAAAASHSRFFFLIRRHNSLDLALHAEAERLLQEHMQQWLQQGVMQQLPTANLVRQQRKQLPKPNGQR